MTYIPGGNLITDEATGAAAIAHSLAIKKVSKLISVSLHLDDGPSDSENYTITINKNAGAAYDTLIYSLDLSTGSTKNLLWLPDADIYLEPGDAIDVAYANTGTDTYGSQITVLELV